MNPDDIRRWRRIAREAANTYVGRHWPTMASLRMSGLGTELTEKREKDPAIRSFISTFSPEFALDLLVALAQAEALRPDAERWRAAEAEGHIVDFTETGRSA